MCRATSHFLHLVEVLLIIISVKGQIIVNFKPTHVPMSGGTIINITISGAANFNVTDVKLANVPATIMNTTLFEAAGWFTCKSEESQNLVTDQVIVSLFNGQFGRTLYSTDLFSYKANPELSMMENNAVVRSGGVMLRIQGSNLDSVSVANLIIKRVYDGGEDKYQSGCTVDNSMLTCVSPDLSEPMTTSTESTTTESATTMQSTTSTAKSTTPTTTTTEAVTHAPTTPTPTTSVATTPTTTTTTTTTTTKATILPNTTTPITSTPVFLSTQSSNRRKRQAENEDYYADFQLDAITFDNFSRIYVFDDPKFYRFSEKDNTKIFFPHRDKQIEIDGEDISLALQRSDYKVAIGTGECFLIAVTVNAITCAPQVTEPTLEPGTTTHRVVVFAGGNLKYFIGYLDYELARSTNLLMLILIVVGIVVFWAIVFTIICVYCVRRKRKLRSAAHDDSSGNIYPSDGSSDSSNQAMPFVGPAVNTDPLDVLSGELRNSVIQCRLDSNLLHIGQCIGTGSYGRVFQGTLIQEQGTITVAIKTLKRVSVTYERDMTEFLQEALLMKDLRHPNIIHLYGVVIFNYAPFVVFEYMDSGDLRSYIKKDKTIPLKTMISYAIQICKALEYLARHKFVHRDVAARNCLVNKENVAKLGDFGLSRDLHGADYYKVTDKSKPLPVKWMALESLQWGRFTSHSDVWSFGVLLWELLSRGQRPYENIQNIDVKNHVRDGNRLPQIGLAYDSLYNIMTLTWREDPSSRPTFEELVIKLQMEYDKMD